MKRLLPMALSSTIAQLFQKSKPLTPSKPFDIFQFGVVMEKMTESGV